MHSSDTAVGRAPENGSALVLEPDPICGAHPDAAWDPPQESCSLGLPADVFGGFTEGRSQCPMVTGGSHGCPRHLPWQVFRPEVPPSQAVGKRPGLWLRRTAGGLPYVTADFLGPLTKQWVDGHIKHHVTDRISRL